MEENLKKHNTKIAVSLIGNAEINRIIKELDATTKKAFDPYIIAYIDFLGMKDRMENKSSYRYLVYLQALIKGIMTKSAFIQRINHINDFEIKIFSDNIVIALKKNDEMLCDQIISLINLISLIQFEAFFTFEFPLRGGITIGELSIDDSVVWGSGLIDAYKIENSLANYPRVIVSQEVIDTYNQCKDKSINIFAMIKQDADGCWFVDYLSAAPNITLIPRISARLSQIANMVIKKDERIKQKTNWIISYFNSYCHQMADRGDYEQYRLPYI